MWNAKNLFFCVLVSPLSMLFNTVTPYSTARDRWFAFFFFFFKSYPNLGLLACALEEHNLPSHAVWVNLARVLPSPEWRINVLNRVQLLDRVSLHTFVTAPSRTPLSRELTFNHWNPLCLKLQASVDFSPCHPSRSQREAVPCSLDVWPALTLQGPRSVFVMLNLKFGSQETSSPLLLSTPTVETIVQTPAYYTAEVQLKANRDSLLY